MDTKAQNAQAQGRVGAVPKEVQSTSSSSSATSDISSAFLDDPSPAGEPAPELAQPAASGSQCDPPTGPPDVFDTAALTPRTPEPTLPASPSQRPVRWRRWRAHLSPVGRNERALPKVRDSACSAGIAEAWLMPNMLSLTTGLISTGSPLMSPLVVGRAGSLQPPGRGTGSGRR